MTPLIPGLTLAVTALSYLTLTLVLLSDMPVLVGILWTATSVGWTLFTVKVIRDYKKETRP